MIEAVSYQRACCVDIAITDSLVLTIGKAFSKEWPLQAHFIAVEILEERITETGRFVIFDMTNGNLAWVKVGDTCEWYPPQ